MVNAELEILFVERMMINQGNDFCVGVIFRFGEETVIGFSDCLVLLAARPFRFRNIKHFRFRKGERRRAAIVAFKLDHLQPFKLILFLT